MPIRDSADGRELLTRMLGKTEQIFLSRDYSWIRANEDPAFYEQHNPILDYMRS
jgi:hypothetical protein